MREEIIIAGFGGQGVVLLGKTIAYLGMKDGKYVTFFPSYGAEMRGGTANCKVILSDEPISSPIVNEPTTLIAMNRPSLDKFEMKVRKGGLVILNSSLIKRGMMRDDIEVIKVPASDIARDVGDARVANMVLLGTYSSKKGIISLDAILNSLKDIIPSHWHSLLEKNRIAIEKGAEWIRS